MYDKNIEMFEAIKDLQSVLETNPELPKRKVTWFAIPKTIQLQQPRKARDQNLAGRVFRILKGY